MEWEFGVSRCKLVYMEWINKVLLYSTGNYIQYPVINHNEKNIKKNVCVCTTESLCLQQKLTQHCKSTILQLKSEFSIIASSELYQNSNSMHILNAKF